MDQIGEQPEDSEDVNSNQQSAAAMMKHRFDAFSLRSKSQSAIDGFKNSHT